MQSEDQTMTEEEIAQLISEVDQDRDGLIDYQEFLEMMQAKAAKKAEKNWNLNLKDIQTLNINRLMIQMKDQLY